MTSFYRTGIIRFSGLFCFVVFVMCWSGCGKKAPPVPPSSKPPAAVDDLSAVLEGDTVRLTWTISEEMAKEPMDLAGVIVCRSKAPLSESECSGCPIHCEHAADIAVKRDDSGKIVGTMSYTEKLERGYRYTYKVNVYTRGGDRSDDSNYAAIGF